MDVGTIGVLIPGVVNHDYLGEVYRGIADTAKQHRHSLLTSIQNPTRHDDLAHFLGPGGCDGVIMVIPDNYVHLVDLCRQYQRECVLIDYPLETGVDDLPTIECTSREGILSAMQHVLALGHRRIGFISGDLSHRIARERYQGYREALEAAGIAEDPALLASGPWSPTDFLTAARQLLQVEPLPTAIVASSDFMAYAVYQAARERGLEIGRQLSVTGFDDIRLASTISPLLTTVRQPMYQMGQTAVELLTRRLNGQPIEALHVRLPTELIVRQSTGRA